MKWRTVFILGVMSGLAGSASYGHAAGSDSGNGRHGNSRRDLVRGCFGFVQTPIILIALRQGKEDSMEINRVTPEKAKELLDSNTGYVYLDVRTVPEFDAGHVPGCEERSDPGPGFRRTHAVESPVRGGCGIQFWQGCEAYYGLPEGRALVKGGRPALDRRGFPMWSTCGVDLSARPTRQDASLSRAGNRAVFQPPVRARPRTGTKISPEREEIAAMMKGAVHNVLEAVGSTPIVKLNKVGSHVAADIYVKCEYLNPGGSMKDRVAINIIRDYERRGLLKPGGTIVEATSGNTGMGLALVAAIRGYKCIFVMPDKMSEEKVKSLQAFGARVVICPTAVDPEDPRSYYSVSRRLAEETPGAVLANQYHNPANPGAHYLSTGPEIWEQTGGEIDVFCAGMGTGGTLSGCARYFKERKPEMKIVGVDPVGSLYYDYVKTGTMVRPSPYKVEGIGEDFLPGTMNLGIIDEVVRVSDKDCFLMTRDLVRREGIYCGGSSGAAVAGAIKFAETVNKKMNIVVLLPDSAQKYLTKIFDDNWMRDNGFLEPDPIGTVADLLAAKAPGGVVTASANDKVRDVITKMKAHGISQVPVTRDGKLIGVVAEIDVLRHMAESGHSPDDSIEKLVTASSPR